MIFRVVPHDSVLDYMLCGWAIADDMQRYERWHDYAVYMKWLCSCRMVEPLKEKNDDKTQTR